MDLPDFEYTLSCEALRQIKAEAWDEGHNTCCDDRCFSDGNPYRDTRENALRAIAPERYTPEDF